MPLEGPLDRLTLWAHLRDTQQHHTEESALNVHEAQGVQPLGPCKAATCPFLNAWVETKARKGEQNKKSSRPRIKEKLFTPTADREKL